MFPVYKTTILTVFTFLLSAFCMGQTASFSYKSANALYCSPVTVYFTQLATGNPSGYSWNFGNGTFSNAPNPSTDFTAGTYTITLVAIYANFTVQSSQTITINPAISVSLTGDRIYICTPGNINFTATPAGNVSSYTFDFGDGTPSITSASNTTSHNYATFGNYRTIVTATSPFGCTATSGFNVRVQKPPLSGSISPTFGCVPITATFSTTVDIPVGTSVTNYAWTFGDGSTASGSSSSIPHTYVIPGTFSPSVTITTNEGCTNSFTFPAVGYGIPPTNLQASVVEPIICGSKTAMFVAQATNANMYLWDYGDNTTDSISSTQAQHKYTTLGIKNVKVTPYYNGCPGTPQNLTIEIIGVIAEFTYKNTCTNRNIYSFFNTSQGNISSYNWTFGDGSPAVNTPNALHIYPLSGTFPTTLFIADSITGCQDMSAVNIYTAKPRLTNPDSAICRYSNTIFTILNNYGNPANIYNWNVLGQTSVSMSNPDTIPGNNLGLYTKNSVIINYGAESCPDTATLNHSVLVRGPVIEFSFNSPVCAFSNVNITNTSYPYIPTDTIKLWYWNYGNSQFNDTSFRPKAYSYAGPGIFYIKLAGVDKNGCKDTLVKPIEVYPVPYLRVVPQRDTLCEGQQATLISFRNRNDLLTWNNSSTLSCATCDTTIATPVITTNYVAKVTNSLGCISTDTSRVLVFNPFTAKVPSANISICAGDSAILSATPPGKIIKWSPAVSISDTTIYNPKVSPRSTTKYTARLIDSVGCFTSSVSVRVVVNPLPSVNAGPDLVLPYANSFQLSPTYTGLISNYLWTPGTNLNCTTCATPTGTALTSERYVIKVTTDSGCIARDTIKVFVECKDAYLYLPNAFTPNGDGRNDYFYPLTRGISTITRFAVFDRFGNTVFSRSNFSPNISRLGWDGKVKGLPQDNSSYVYLMEAICDQGEKLMKKGNVVMIR